MTTRTDLPLILITNDDSINAQGLWWLVAAAEPYARIAVVAPHYPQSWTGRSHRSDPDPLTPPHDLTDEHHQLNKTLVHIYTHRWAIPVTHPEGCWSVTATPARTVRTGLSALGLKPTLLLSGINGDINAGSGVTASGTLGAAWEAAEAGIPALAISTPPYKEQPSITPPPALLHHVQSLIQHALITGLPMGTSILNVNLPHDITLDTEWRVTRTSRLNPYDYWATEEPNPAHRSFDAAQYDPQAWRLHSKPIVLSPTEMEPDSDLRALADNTISLTFLPSRLGITPNPVSGGVPWRSTQ